MTLPRKGTRTIQIEESCYRFKVTGNDMIIDVVVEKENSRGQKLTSTFEYHNETENGEMKKQERVVTPVVIKQLVLLGLKNGWNPVAKGRPNFHINGEEHFPLK